MMKTSNLALSVAFFAATALAAATSHADEAGAESAKGGGRAGGDRDAVAPLVQHAAEKLAPDHVAEGGADRLKERQLAEGGSDRLIERRVAEGGSDRLIERRLAADGADRVKHNNVAGYNPMRGTRVAEGGSDKLIQNRVADGGYGYDSSSEVMPHFCMQCR